MNSAPHYGAWWVWRLLLIAALLHLASLLV